MKTRKERTIKFLRGGLRKYQKKIRTLKKYGEKISCTNQQSKKKSSKLFIKTYVCEKNLAMKCVEKKSCLTGTKKNMHKKIAQPPPLSKIKWSVPK